MAADKAAAVADAPAAEPEFNPAADPATGEILPLGTCTYCGAVTVDPKTKERDYAAEQAHIASGCVVFKG